MSESILFGCYDRSVNHIVHFPKHPNTTNDDDSADDDGKQYCYNAQAHSNNGQGDKQKQDEEQKLCHDFTPTIRVVDNILI